MKGIFKYYTDLLAQSRPGTPGRPPIVDQPVAGQGTGENLSEVWSKKTKASQSATPIYGPRTPITSDLINSAGTFSGFAGGITPVTGATTPVDNSGVSSEILIEKLNKLETVQGKLKSLELVDKFDTLSSEIDKASKEIRRKLIERNVLKDEATLALMQAKKELEAEVLRMKEMLASAGINTNTPLEEPKATFAEVVSKVSVPKPIEIPSENNTNTSPAGRENVTQSSKVPVARIIFRNAFGEEIGGK